jgi:hypothetical protein
MTPTSTSNTATGKIFGIGLSRTGAQTLTDSLVMLGYRSHFVLIDDDLDALLAKYDAFTHFPLVEQYADLDRRFPGSKFILTVREREDWLKSIEYRLSLPAANASAASLALLRRVYGSETFDRELYSSAYDRYCEGVKEHFQGREDSLLILDLCGGEGFEKICPFLGQDVPPDSFPHSKKNSRAELQKPRQKLKRFLTRYFKAYQIKRFFQKKFGK